MNKYHIERTHSRQFPTFGLPRSIYRQYHNMTARPEDKYSEKEFLLHLAAGDEAAFRIIYERYWDRIYSLAMRYFRSPPIAQDMVQDVFLKIWTRRAELVAVDRFEAFFFILARNLMLNEVRKKLPPMVNADAPGVFLPEENLVPDRQLSVRETANLIRRAIASLSPRQQQIYRMSREQGLKQEHIARELGISHNTVREHMSKALAGIRAFLEDHLDEFGVALLLLLLS